VKQNLQNSAHVGEEMAKICTRPQQQLGAQRETTAPLFLLQATQDNKQNYFTHIFTITLCVYEVKG
jgi:hypothetical protein